jgi:hypothetical protein
MTQNQVSTGGVSRARYPYPWMLAVLYGRGSTMDQTFRYLSSHGLIAVGLMQPFYKCLKLLHDYVFTDAAVLDYYLIPIPLKLRIDGTRISCSVKLVPGMEIVLLVSDVQSWRRARRLAVLVISLSLCMVLLFAIMSILATVLNLPYKILMVALKCWSTTLTSAVRSVPVLIAALVLVFTTGDAWRLYGSESTVRFEILIVIILAIGIAAMVAAVLQAEGGWRELADKTGENSRGLCKLASKTPARNLAIKGVAPTEDMGVRYTKWLRRNVRFLFWFTLVLDVFSIAFVTCISFAFIGMVVVSAQATSDLLQSRSIDILWDWRLLGQSFVMTKPLLLLSILFGCIAALTFATTGLQDERNLSRVMQFALLSHRKSLSALAYYLGSIIEIQKKLSWSAVYSELQANDRTAVLDAIQTMLEQSPPWVICAIFNVAYRRNFCGWAGSQGVAILEKISDRKLARISIESRNFVLAAVDDDPARAAITQSINRRIEKIDSDAE